MKNYNSSAGNTMRKLLATALAVPMVFSVFVSVLAEEPANTKNVDIKYKVEQSYEWSVPSSISADGGMVEVNVTKNLIQDGKVLKITVDSANDFVLKNANDATDTVAYSITANSKAWTDGCTVLSVDADTSSSSVIASTAIFGTFSCAGAYSDTLTFETKIIREITGSNAIFPTIRTQYPNATFDSNTLYDFECGPFIYQNLDLFKNKTITKIGFPVGTIDYTKSEQTFTVYVLKNNTTDFSNKKYEREYTLTASTSVFETTGNTVDKWFYFENLNIELGADETLGFGKKDKSDTIRPYYYQTSDGIDAYEFYAYDANQDDVLLKENSNLVIDIYYKQVVEVLDDTVHALSTITRVYDNSKISGLKDLDYTKAPFIYKQLSLFEGKRIVRIGFPVKKVSALNANQYVTVRVVSNSFDYKTADSYDSLGSDKTYQLPLPLNELGTDKDAVNKWIYVDCDIQLAEGETLAFVKEGDPVTLGYDSTSETDEFNFFNRNSGSDSWAQLLFDVVYEENGYEEITDLDAYLLKQALRGKFISILGDGISSFDGYSNKYQANTKTSNFNAYYKGSGNDVTSVDKTWWLKAINDTGMNLLVNTSVYGSKIYGKNDISKSSLDVGYSLRCQYLHDNYNVRKGITPDIIAVFMGTNDVNGSGTIGTAYDTLFNYLITDKGNGTFTYGGPTTKAEAYIIMVHRMITMYPDAKIFLFTLNQCATGEKNDQDRIQEMNTAIKAVAQKYSLNVVDLYNEPGFDFASRGTHSIDSLHPNTIGMQYIENAFIKALKAEYVK